jgi:STE24 endopeptidase
VTGWAGPLALAVGAAHATTTLLRPRGRLIEAAPVRVSDHFSPAEIRRARRYGRPQLALHGAAVLLDAAALAWLIRRRRRGPAEEPRHPARDAALTGAGLVVGLTAAGLPISALLRQRALDVGLATQSWRGWAQDVVKATALNAGLSAGGAAIAIGLMRRERERWWIAGAAGSVGLGVLVTFVGPVVLDPIFNRFTPLADRRTRDDVLELARAAGVRVAGVYEMDASRRTTAANAYVNGIGATRRVVLFDTLLRTFSRDEARLVVAHELAHVRNRDVLRGLAQMAIVAAPSMRAVAALTDQLEDGRAPSGGTVPALALSFGIVSAVASIAGLPLIRNVERRADAFALELTDAPEAFVSFERKIVLQNLADPDPSRWLTRLLATHPSTLERIGIAKAYAATRAEPRLASSNGPLRARRRRRRTPAGS